MLLIYLPSVTPRSEYIFTLVFKNELGLDFRVTTDIRAFDEYKHEKLNYSDRRINHEIFIRASTLLFERSIEKINITVEKKSGTAIVFPNNQNCDAGFDVFAAVFYMVSRYEEYLTFTPDKHGRFPAAASIAFKNNFLQYPVVNHWISHLKKILTEKYSSLKFKSTFFKAILTYDIDVAYAYKGRGFARWAGGLVKDIAAQKFKNAAGRIRTFVSGKDPWDIYDDLEQLIPAKKLDSIFFFLVGDYSRYDKNIKFDHPLMKHLVKKVSAVSDIGIHPSYKTSEISKKILIEKERLEKLCAKPVTKSRQHYLRFKLPDTYNDLIKAGITEEYSMGFADMPGFRAGICTPFYFYDLKNETATSLKLFPVSLMDASFLYYLNLNPGKSIEIIFDLLLEVKKVNGMFISIWHNNTLSEHGNFKKWKFVHEEMIKKIAALSNTE